MQKCQFDFPKDPGPQKLICRKPVDSEEESDTIKIRHVLSKVHIIPQDNNEVTLNELLFKSSICMEEYIKSLKISHSVTCIILK